MRLLCHDKSSASCHFNFMLQSQWFLLFVSLMKDQNGVGFVVRHSHVIDVDVIGF